MTLQRQDLLELAAQHAEHMQGFVFSALPHLSSCRSMLISEAVCPPLSGMEALLPA